MNRKKIGEKTTKKRKYFVKSLFGVEILVFDLSKWAIASSEINLSALRALICYQKETHIHIIW